VQVLPEQQGSPAAPQATVDVLVVVSVTVVVTVPVLVPVPGEVLVCVLVLVRVLVAVSPFESLEHANIPLTMPASATTTKARSWPTTLIFIGVPPHTQWIGSISVSARLWCFPSNCFGRELAFRRRESPVKA
jgi:hypothetical protein